MYQYKVTSSVPISDNFYLYENLDSLGVKNKDTFDNTNLILVEFRGQTTNWNRTVITLAPPYVERNTRTWGVRFELVKTNWLGIMDSEAQRRLGKVFLPQPEIYNINFYYQTSTTNLDVNNATKIDLTSQINLERTIDDSFNDAPVSSYTEYTDNDVVDGKNNTNIEYGIN